MAPEAVVRVQTDDERLAASVVHHIEAHRDHIRGQAFDDLAKHLGERAKWLRSAPLALDDPLAQAFLQHAHTEAGLVVADPRIVAATAYEWLAAELAAGVFSDAGQARTEDTDG
ncbi:hypothetical protein ACFXJ8_26250 [Nonomuraea sp. NPDC059194]|uniref:hypothetical protein n=1 Tax=Nonomuraea sp. NPDC059194 TaxID=3346764 RepID=UPI0036996457